MQYMVVGADGKEYGPATVDTLKQWAAEGRLFPSTQLRDFGTGQVLLAGSLPGLFAPTAPTPPPAADWSQPPNAAAYARPVPQYGRIYSDDGKGELTGAIIRCCIAIALFFVFKWAGIISGIYAMVYAVQAKSKGHKYGTAAIIMASIVLLIVVVGNFLNFNGS